MARLTAVHVVPYYPPHSGGMERVAAELVRALPGCGVDPLVITSDIGVAGVLAPPVPGVTRLRTVEFAHTPLMRGLVRALRRLPPGSIVHAHVAQAFIPDLAAALAHRHGHPVVAHYHLDVDPTGPLGVLLLRPYQRTLLRYTLRRAEAVLVPTPDYAEIVRRTYGVQPARIHVLPGGTSIPLASAARPDPPADRPWRLVSVGRLNDQKNHALLLAALARLPAGVPWSLDLYGDGELRPALEQQARQLGLGPRVQFRGEGFGPAHLQAAYDAADLFVLASRKESFGVVFVEAMARGLPIVSTDVAGTRNVVRPDPPGLPAGLLVAQTPAALAEAIAQLMADAVLYRQLSAGGLAAAADYRWPDVARRLAEIYGTLRGREL